MYLKKIKLLNFRNYESLSIEFNPHVNIIYGNNAQGKTNLLESIYVLSQTKSHLNILDNCLIKDNKDYLKIIGIVKNNKLNTKYEISYSNSKKQFKIDDKNITTMNDYINNSINIIFFYPEDLEIIKGSPIDRRNYLNLELGQLSNNYLKILTDFNKLLKMRNDLLKNKNFSRDYFDIITNYFIEKSYLIYKMRLKFISEINKNVEKIFQEITNLQGFNIKYSTNFNFIDYKIDLKKILNQNYDREIKLGTTLFGPHRDDIEFFLNEINLKLFGSQGQKRLAILAMKISEISIFKTFKNTNPILLLDDVFSELDDIKKNNVIKYLSNDVQVFITTTEKRKINKNKFTSVSLFKIKNGEIIKTEEV